MPENDEILTMPSGVPSEHQATVQDFINSLNSANDATVRCIALQWFLAFLGLSIDLDC